MYRSVRCIRACGCALRPLQQHQPINVSLPPIRQCSDANNRFKPGRGTGDTGQSSLYTLERRWKDDDVFQALGDLDELGSQLAVCRQRLVDAGMADIAALVLKVQCCLQDIASHVATPQPRADSPAAGKRAIGAKIEQTKFDGRLTDELNDFIDVYAEKLPPLKQFILSGGGHVASHLHVSRSVCRRAERSLSRLLREQQIDAVVYTYVNRLSDLLFVLARRTSQLQSQPELAYKKPQVFDQSQTSTLTSRKL